jgi:hypothetical protein
MLAVGFSKAFRPVLALAFCIVLPLSAGQKPADFYFGGQRLNIGMQESDAVASMSVCCTLTPPVSSSDRTVGSGHFIRTKDGPPYRMLGSIWFADGKVSRISQPIDEDFDGYNDDVVRLARALSRALAATSGDSSSTLMLSVQHTRMSNGNGDTVSLTFPNGRGIELQVITLDNPDKTTNKRDAVTLDEVLQSPQPLK